MTKLTRIKEVKKILNQNVYYHAEEYGESGSIQVMDFNLEEATRQISQLFPQPLPVTEVEELEEPPDETCATEEELRQMEQEATAKAESETFPQPLDDKELREKAQKLKGMIKGITTLSTDREKWSEMFEIIDQILALLQPKIEEAKRGIIELIENMPCFYSEKLFPTTTEEAGKFLTDRGISDNDKSAISGAIARLGWNNAVFDILKALKGGE